MSCRRCTTFPSLPGTVHPPEARRAKTTTSELWNLGRRGLEHLAEGAKIVLFSKKDGHFSISFEKSEDFYTICNRIRAVEASERKELRIVTLRKRRGSHGRHVLRLALSLKSQTSSSTPRGCPVQTPSLSQSSCAVTAVALDSVSALGFQLELDRR